MVWGSVSHHHLGIRHAQEMVGLIRWRRQNITPLRSSFTARNRMQEKSARAIHPRLLMGLSWWKPAVSDAIPLTRKQRKSIRREAWDLVGWPRKILFAAVFTGLIMGADGITRLVDSGASWISRGVLYAVLMSLAWWISDKIVLREFARSSRMVVRNYGFDVCLDCGYWLRGLDPNIEKCPECGADRQPHVDRPN